MTVRLPFNLFEQFLKIENFHYCFAQSLFDQYVIRLDWVSCLMYWSFWWLRPSNFLGQAILIKGCMSILRPLNYFKTLISECITWISSEVSKLGCACVYILNIFNTVQNKKRKQIFKLWKNQGWFLGPLGTLTNLIKKSLGP